MMEQLTDHHYEVLSVPEESAANCVYIRGPSNQDFLLHRPAEECPDSIPVSVTKTVESDRDLSSYLSRSTCTFINNRQVATFP